MNHMMWCPVLLVQAVITAAPGLFCLEWLPKSTSAAGPTTGVWATLVLMGISALCGAFTDLNFNLKGYLWQLLNCLFTAGYALMLRNVMDKVRTQVGCLALVLCKHVRIKHVRINGLF